MDGSLIPPFRPRRLLGSAHAQTLAAALFPGPRIAYSAEQHRVPLADGDEIVLHDDCPADWQPSDPVALLMHGLAGCHQSGYMRRIAAKLCDRGVRAFRMDHRGCGAGAGLARLPYNAGASDDVATVIAFIERLAPHARLSLVGFSLSANILLKLLGERGTDVPSTIESAIAVCPPIDLQISCENMTKWSNRLYDRHFVRLLMRQVRYKQRTRGDVPRIQFHGRVRRLVDFDDQYTAPLAGYSGAEEYYSRSSANQFLPTISIPTTILASRDDPMIPIHTIENATLSPTTRLITTEHGGHLGFLGQSSTDADHYWMDWRVVEWVLNRTEHGDIATNHSRSQAARATGAAVSSIPSRRS